MKLPTPRRLPSGSYTIQLRLNGKSISITEATPKECIRKAQLIKAQHLAGIVQEKWEPKTLRQEIDRYIAVRANTLSPLTIRGYRIIQRGRFQGIMDRQIASIKPEEWQTIVNAEAGLCAPKTLQNAWGLVRSVVQFSTGKLPPKVSLPQIPPPTGRFLTPTQIKVFVPAVAKTPYAIPALLGLSSLRISEIAALRWENIPIGAKLIKVQGAIVLDENNQLVQKKTNKNRTSTRPVPIVIPELSEAMEAARQKRGPVMTMTQNSFRAGLLKVCRENGLPELTPHDLRRSYASLAYHLHIPEKIAAEIGGWSDLTTMHKIYTMIAQEDIDHYSRELENFYAGEIANENADES